MRKFGRSCEHFIPNITLVCQILPSNVEISVYPKKKKTTKAKQKRNNKNKFQCVWIVIENPFKIEITGRNQTNTFFNE